MGINKNLFYIDKSFPNILGRLYWDLDNKPFKPFNITELNYNKVENQPKHFPEYLKHITLIGVSDNMIIDKNISSICTAKDTENRKYFSNISLYELQKLKDIRSSNITPSMYTNIVKEYPQQVIDDGRRNKIPDTGLVFTENYRDDVLFYTDINQLEDELRTSCDERVFGESAYKLYNLTVRFRMPFYQIHNIIMLDRNNHLQIKGFNYMPCDWSKRMDDKFSFGDICWCVITANIDTWSKICKLHVYEEINFLPVISFMYHCVLNYPYIKYGLKRNGLDEQRLLDNLYQTTRR